MQTCSGIHCSDGGCLRPLQDPQQTKWSILQTAHPAPHPTPQWQVRWRRIVLDEAHSIKDRRCSTAKAVFKLDSEYK